MTIFMVSHNYKPYSGGVVSSIDACAQGLRDAGHCVYIISLDFGGSIHEEYVIRLYCPLTFVFEEKVCAVPFGAGQQLADLIKFLRPDIIHTHHPFLLGDSARVVARRHNIPIVFTHHTRYSAYVHHIPFPQSLVAYYVTHKVRFFCNHVNQVIAPSTSIQALLKNQHVTTPITVIPSPLLEKFYQTTYRKSVAQTLRFRLLCVSRFEREKNLLVLIQLLKNLPHDFVLSLVGFGTYESLLKKQVEDLNVAHRVKFIIKPTRERLIQEYEQADMFVFSSQTETQGLVLAEAMAMGLPVIALAGPGVEDIIEHGKNGFMAHTPPELRDYIIMLASNKQLYAQLSHAAYQTSLRYQQTPIVKRLVTLYAAALKT